MLERLIDTATHVGLYAAFAIVIVGSGYALVYGLAKILKQEPRFIAGSIVVLYFVGVVIALGYYWAAEGNPAFWVILACLVPLVPFLLKRR